MSEVTKIVISLGVLVAAAALGLAIHSLLIGLVSRWHSKRPIVIQGMPLRLEHWRAPLRALFPAAFVALALPALYLSSGLLNVIGHVVGLWVIAAVAWFLMRTVTMASDMILSRYDITATESLSERGISTQVRMFERVLHVVIVVVAAAIMFMSFNSLREFGVSILASAGIAGLVIGFAAQRSIATLLAGVHIALTQPIRLGDAIHIEGEFGRVEEITLSYVVVKLWDERRLIVPISHFIEKPFQNWTRESAALIGAVFLYCDYRIPVQELRDELKRILESTDPWNGRVWALQVTDATQEAVKLRVLCSADNAPQTWDLRCYVREKLIEFMRQRFPDSLPQKRIELTNNKRDQNSRGVRSAAY
jgi:small-conductance mechanosensitive channel